MSVTAWESTLPALPRPAFEMHDRFEEVIELGLSGADYAILFHLAARMQTGNRVAINQRAIAAAIRVSPETVRRSLSVLRATRLLLSPDEGLSVINPVYLVHNIAERSQLVKAFGNIDVVRGVRAARRTRPMPRRGHLALVSSR